MNWFAQENYDIRFEWGLEGALQLSSLADVTIVVDVLSFSTCVDIATSRGAAVYPYLFKDERAVDFAKTINAKLAATERSKSELCLSPTSMNLLNAHDNVVLPSPNGSSICFSVKDSIVMCGCLRNAEAVAKKANQLGKKILVVAAGEKWNNDTLRPALEDQIGAGAILSFLKGTKSPEAISAINIFEMAKSDLRNILNGCASGQELIQRGFPEDNILAAQLNVSQTTPILVDNYLSADAQT
jgi:2-phosphosulfolactate phosphatase